MSTNTQRTLKGLRALGLKCGIVERFLYFAGPHGKRVDLFNIIDIIALDYKRGVVGVQSCGSSYSAHLKKMLEEHRQDSIDWLQTPGTVLELWAWRKIKKKRGGKQLVWRPRIKIITVKDLE